MLISNAYLTIFAVAMTGCVLATPLVTWLANGVGAIDRPDQFRRIHKGAVPRLGGLALALGVFAGAILPSLLNSWRVGSTDPLAIGRHLALLGAAVVILIVGFIDDMRSIGPRAKLLGQAAAVILLYFGGVRIQAIEVLSLNLNLDAAGLGFNLLGWPIQLAPLSFLATLLWFLGCMNIWNLIDGMDGLASGVGLLVSGTLTLVAIHNDNFEVAVLAVALAGGLAGFLLYNWHPACIFLGDSGSMLIGLLIGVIGVEGSMEGPSAISILFPILAMGLPISDTAMAIFRRWVRNLPLSAADRRHVHHILIGLGLGPRRAALLLYCFSGFLCGAVMLGVAFRNEYLTLVLGISGCLVFLLVVTSRRDDLANLREDFQDRLTRGRQEREAAKLAWEAIQRIELAAAPETARAIFDQAARSLGCDQVSIQGPGSQGDPAWDFHRESEWGVTGSGSSAIVRAPCGVVGDVEVFLEIPREPPFASDIVFRYVQRLAQALADHLERRHSNGSAEPAIPVEARAAANPGRPSVFSARG